MGRTQAGHSYIKKLLCKCGHKVGDHQYYEGYNDKSKSCSVPDCGCQQYKKAIS